MANSALTPKQARFVAEYLVDLNGAAAARRAGYAEAGAHVTASRLLRVPKVAAAIAEAQGKRAEKTGITAERVVEEVAAIAFSDVGAAFDSEGNLLPFKDMPAEVRRAIAGVETTELNADDGPTGKARKLRKWDKVKALELLAKLLGLLRDKVGVSGEGGGGLQIFVQTYKDKEQDK